MTTSTVFSIITLSLGISLLGLILIIFGIMPAVLKQRSY